MYYVEREHGDILRHRVPQTGDSKAYYPVSKKMLETRGLSELGQLPTLFFERLYLVRIPEKTS